MNLLKYTVFSDLLSFKGKAVDLCMPLVCRQRINRRIIIGSDRRPGTKQGIEGKIVRLRSGRVRDRNRVRDKDGSVYTQGCPCVKGD